MSKSKKDEIREAAEADLELFIRLVHPHRVLGQVHIDVIRWWTRADAKSHQLLLLPRDHGKSALTAYRVAWEITRNPSVRILYISSTANLATKQLKFIKDILTSDIYRYYWPEMVNFEESKREKWTESEISVDHPIRKAEAVRDPTVFTAGLTTGITGLHCDVSVFDDVVVADNANTEEGRAKVAAQYSLLASIEGTTSRQWVCGTRYHLLDLYAEMMQIKVEQFDEDTEEQKEPEPLYEVYERAVEDRGDGYGQFLWPKQMRADGKWFGFDEKVLARKKAQYLDKTQFFAQYYNNPNDADSAPIKRELFQYYDKSHLRREGGNWTFQGRRLNIFAAIDFAFSLNKKADSSSLVVIGVDANMNYYVLDIERFKTDRISDYFAKILSAHQRWGFRKLRAEVTVAQQVIVKDLKENYIRPYGLALSIEDYRPTRQQGSKEERMAAILQPRYENRQMWHYKDGNCQILEEELVLQRPPHDDVMDALANAVDMAVAPSNMVVQQRQRVGGNNVVSHPRFGGIL
jgi:hypothetical protein